MQWAAERAHLFFEKRVGFINFKGHRGRREIIPGRHGAKGIGGRCHIQWRSSRLKFAQNGVDDGCAEAADVVSCPWHEACTYHGH